MARQKIYFRDKVERIFGPTSWYTEDQQKRAVEFEVEGNSVTYDALTQLSRVLKTHHINLNGGSHQGCETCGPDDYTSVRAENVTFK